MSVTLIIAGSAIALVLFALVISLGGKPKKAEPSERGEILKQLLALSERETATSQMTPAAMRGPRLAFATAATTASLPQGRPREQYSKRKEPIRTSKSPVPLRTKDTEVEEQIRRRAYELYQQGGRIDGKATDDWLKAKDEVLRSKGKPAKSLS